MSSSEGFALLYGAAVLFGVSYLLYKGRHTARPVLDAGRGINDNSYVLKGGMDTVKPFSMDDVGTRLEHLMELHDLWNTMFGILTADRWHTAVEIAQAEELEIAIKLLDKHMLFGYSNRKYAQEINSLPKSIPDPTGE